MRARVSVALSTLLLAFLAVPAAAAPILSVSPTASIVNVGDTFTINIDISNVTDLYGFQFDLSFDPAFLQVVPQTVGSNTQDVVEGPFLGTGGATDFLSGVNNGLGTIGFTLGFLLGNVSGVSGNGTLASITFMALATGVSPLTLSNFLLLDSQLAEMAASISDGSVTVESAVVPEPATIVLLTTGIGLAARRRFTQRRRKA